MQYKKVVATRSGGPEVLELVEEELSNPGAGEVRIKVAAAGVLLADILWQQGLAPGGPKPPFTPGYDVVGVVDAVGEDVVNFQEGQTVAALIQFQGYAQYANVPAGRVVLVPEGLDPAEVICLTVGYLTAYQIFHHVAKLVPGRRVLVHGAAGGTGSAMLDLGRQMGLEVYGTASRPKHDLVASLGATPINYRHDDFVRNICEFTDDGVDLVVDPIGGPNLSRSFETLRPGGLLVSTAAMSAVRGDVTPMAAASAMIRLPIWNALPNKRKAMAFDVVRYSSDHLDDYHEDLERLMDLLAAGQIEPVIGSRFPLEEAVQAQELLLAFGAQGKVVLINDWQQL